MDLKKGRSKPVRAAAKAQQNPGEQDVAANAELNRNEQTVSAEAERSECNPGEEEVNDEPIKIKEFIKDVSRNLVRKGRLLEKQTTYLPCVGTDCPSSAGYELPDSYFLDNIQEEPESGPDQFEAQPKDTRFRSITNVTGECKDMPTVTVSSGTVTVAHEIKLSDAAIQVQSQSRSIGLQTHENWKKYIVICTNKAIIQYDEVEDLVKRVQDAVKYPDSSTLKKMYMSTSSSRSRNSIIEDIDVYEYSCPYQPVKDYSKPISKMTTTTTSTSFKKPSNLKQNPISLDAYTSTEKSMKATSTTLDKLRADSLEVQNKDETVKKTLSVSSCHCQEYAKEKLQKCTFKTMTNIDKSTSIDKHDKASCTCMPKSTVKKAKVSHKELCCVQTTPIMYEKLFYPELFEKNNCIILKRATAPHNSCYNFNVSNTSHEQENLHTGPGPVEYQRTEDFLLDTNENSSTNKQVFSSISMIFKTVTDNIRTCLGPRSMLKMMMDQMGRIIMTNDGNAILRELIVQHPSTKIMVEVARTQEEETGDGTKSVIILAGEVFGAAEQFITQQMHPTIVIAAYRQALEDILDDLKNKIAVPVDIRNREEMMKIVKSCLGTKVLNKWVDLACNIALEATSTVLVLDNDKKEIDIKRYAKIEKIPGGLLENSKILKGVMINKDITHPNMRRRIENPRILLLDCNLEYKKGESVTNIEISKEEDFSKILKLEEEFVEKVCKEITALKPDLVITEKGVSDLAQHYLVKENISVIRRVRKSDNNRIARACGAIIANRTDELKEEDIGTGCGLFEIQKIGNEYYTFLTKCKNPKACTILLRGASKDILNEVERNLQDAMNVARNVMIDPFLVPGGGATEMAIAQALNERAKSITGVHQWPYRAISRALEVIPRTLIQNCGADPIRTLTAIRAKHAQPNSSTWGIDGNTGNIVDMKVFGVWESISVKQQVFKTAIETAILLLRIDDIIYVVKKQGEGDAASAPPQGAQASEGPEQ